MDIVYAQMDYSNVWGLINDTVPIRFIKESYELLLWLSICSSKITVIFTRICSSLNKKKYYIKVFIYL